MPLRRLFLAMLLALPAGCGAPVPQPDPPPPAEARPQPTASPFRPLPVIPTAYLGRWDINAAACAGPPGEMRLQVEPGQLRFHESFATVEAASEQPGSIEVDLAFSGEGESWYESRRLRLLEGGRLAIETAEGRSVRIRCDAGPPPVADTFGWSIGSNGEDVSLSFLGRDDQAAVTLICVARSNDLLVNVAGFRPVASEERMTIGSGGVATALVADAAGDSVRGGVSATGPIPVDLDEILTKGEGIGVNYGSQTRVFPALPGESAARFLRACGD